MSEPTLGTIVSVMMLAGLDQLPPDRRIFEMLTTLTKLTGEHPMFPVMIGPIFDNLAEAMGRNLAAAYSPTGGVE